jgi:hypothetical protein
MYESYVAHSSSKDDHEQRASNITDLHSRISALNFTDVLNRAHSREKYHAIMEAANKRLAAEKSAPRSLNTSHQHGESSESS